VDLEKIVGDLKRERDRLSQAITLLSGDSAAPERATARPATPAKRRGGITAAGRRRLSQAMKRRWAERRIGKTTGKASAPKRRGGLTAAGRKKLSEAMKKRWAEKKKNAS
jgi:hypothetical protein